MANANISGPLDSLFDPTSGQGVYGTIAGTISYEGPDANFAQLQAAILRATADVLRQKLAANQVAVPTIAQSLPYFAQEIAMAANAGALGMQVTGLQIAFTPAPAAAPAAPMAPQAMPVDPMTAMQLSMEKKAAAKLAAPQNVRAQVNIGGFKVRASTQGGLDTDGLLNQAKDKAKTEIIWYIGGCLIVGVVLAGLCGLGGYIYYKIKAGNNPSSAAEAAAGSWDGHTPFTCGGNDAITLDGVTADLPNDTAVTAGGNCTLTLSNMTIHAKTGISAGANAHVTVTGGSITGSDAAAEAMGNSTITFSGTIVTGEKNVLGAAHINGP